MQGAWDRRPAVTEHDLVSRHVRRGFRGGGGGVEEEDGHGDDLALSIRMFASAFRFCVH